MTLSNSGVEAATVAITAVLTSCGGFGMYCSMNLTSSYRVIHLLPSSLLLCPITRSNLNSEAYWPTLWSFGPGQATNRGLSSFLFGSYFGGSTVGGTNSSV